MPASQVIVSPERLGICRVDEISAASVEEARRLLQYNHDTFHIFWRDANGHNHTAHNLLTSLALGASPAELQQAFDDDKRDQARRKPDPDPEAVKALADPDTFYSKLGQGAQYPNFMAFFEAEIDAKGWKQVMLERCFSRTRNADALLARLYDGAFHSIIHVGLGVEFELPSIIAEGLAQGATDHTVGIEAFFRNAEQEALTSNPPSRPLRDLLHDVRADDTIHHAARWSDLGPAKMRDGVFGRAGKEIASLAAQFRVNPENLEYKIAETMSCAAYFSAAAQRPGKERKIDFFYMHDVTSSILVSVLARQPWIKIEDRARVVEWKGRIDLAWYATCGAPELHLDALKNYKPSYSAGMDWNALFRAINAMHDDGHVAKFVRALKHGQEIAEVWEHGDGSEDLPVTGDLWFTIARMAYDTNLPLPEPEKWIFFAGFDQAWEKVGALVE